MTIFSPTHRRKPELVEAVLVLGSEADEGIPRWARDGIPLECEESGYVVRTPLGTSWCESKLFHENYELLPALESPAQIAKRVREEFDAWRPPRADILGETGESVSQILAVRTAKLEQFIAAAIERDRECR